MTSVSIPGQEELKHVFRKMVDEGRVPHAMLIHANEGGSGLPLAIYLTQMLLCESREGGDACGRCPACTRTQRFIHPDVHFIYPVNTNKTIKRTEDRHSESYVAEWRSALLENPYMDLIDWYKITDLEKKQGFIGEEESKSLRRILALRSFEGGYRVIVIWNADKMNETFANKMLKNLEEPSPKTLFLLISENPSQLLTTILSRVQLFREEHLQEKELSEFLIDYYQVDPESALDIAFRVEGNINQAIKEAQNTEDVWLTEFKLWVRMAYSRDLNGLFKWSEAMSRRARDSQREFCVVALKILDRCYRMGWMPMRIPMVGEEAKFYKDFSPFINTSNVAGFLEILEEASLHIERNVNGKIVWYDTSIQAIRLVHAGKKQVTAN